MPPKFKFTREQILDAALELTREGGLKNLTARSLADRLGSSTKPIFGAFRNMDEVEGAVMAAARDLYQRYVDGDMRAGKYPPYKGAGMAYIRFAREERELFKLLFMRDRTGETIREDREEIRPLLDLLMEKVGLTEAQAYMFHLEMWIFVHGIATMAATDYLNMDEEMVSRVLTDIFQGLKCRYTGKKE